MKIAIHLSENIGFTERWIEYCRQNNISYKTVNAYNTDILDQISDCDAFMWHHHQANYKDVLFAKQLLFSIQATGKNVFPDFNTCWHFDDKVGQKYLFEAIGAPLVPTYVFFTEHEALDWLKNTSFPKVFKLRCGAASANVKLIKSRNEAQKIIKKAFGKGFSQYDWHGHFKEAKRKYKEGKSNLRNLLRPLYYGAKKFPTKFAKYKGNEKGYVYFQDFIPDNTFDIRIIVIGNKAFGIKRLTRENDFTASGSGHILYGREDLDERCVKIAFSVNQYIRAQSIAYDFVFDGNNIPLIVEISYCFMASGYDACTGYWDKDLFWHEGPFNPYGWMIDMILEK